MWQIARLNICSSSSDSLPIESVEPSPLFGEMLWVLRCVASIRRMARRDRPYLASTLAGLAYQAAHSRLSHWNQYKNLKIFRCEPEGSNSQRDAV